MFPTFARREEPTRGRGRAMRPLRVVLLAATLVTLSGLASATVPEASSSRPVTFTQASLRIDLLPEPAPRIDPFAGIQEAAPELGFTRRPDLDAQRAGLAQPPTAARSAVPEPKAESKGPTGKVRARGDATWYCLDGRSPCHHAKSGGLYAAAGPALRVGDWRGRRVTVCQASDCVRVTLIDWCACGSGRVIDLYSDAFRRLASLGTGEIRVSVRW